MADDKDKSSVLGDKEQFGKHGTGPADKGGEDAKAREELGRMAEKTKSPGTSGGSSGSGRS